MCCDLFFSLGPEVSAIILKNDFSFGLSVSSHVFQSFWFQKFLKLSRSESINESKVFSQFVKLSTP